SMDRAIGHFERLVIGSLLVLLAIVLALSVVDLTWVLVQDVINPPVLILEIDELLELFGLFLLVLIGVELFEAIYRTYLHERVDRAEVVIIVAIIAIARKVIVIDLEKTEPLTVVGIGVVIVALTVGYFLLRRTRRLEAASAPGEAEAVSDADGGSDPEGAS
ncbi:MAG TPA: phosphate-starvation-inducible PsiE family protein, partial [Gaiellaceae bacterium]|nr:phosphate-starvation-inducible PsiE family protein [Gaiellaceae bacterium]